MVGAWFAVFPQTDWAYRLLSYTNVAVGLWGVLHLARDDKQAGKMRTVVATHQPPADYLRYAEQDEASRIAGWPLAQGGWHFPGGGWIQPPSLCSANLAAGGAAIQTLFPDTTVITQLQNLIEALNHE